MEITTILIYAGLIILGIILLKLIFKITGKVILVVLILAVIGYFLFFWRGGLLRIGEDDFILTELKAKYCLNEPDAAKCICIIDPILNDIEGNYSPEEINILKENKLKSLQVIYQALRNNKVAIQECLKDKGASNAWDEFIIELKSIDAKKELQDFYESLKH